MKEEESRKVKMENVVRSIEYLWGLNKTTKEFQEKANQIFYGCGCPDCQRFLEYVKGLQNE